MNRKYPIRIKRAKSMIYFLCAALLVLFTSCSGEKEVKQASRESLLSQEAFSVAEALRSAYSKKEFDLMAEKCTKEGYRAIMDSIRHFDSVELTFTPKWVEIEKNIVYLNVAWKGTWTVGQDTVRERGMAVFLLEGAPLKLSKIERGNPFRYPERP